MTTTTRSIRRAHRAAWAGAVLAVGALPLGAQSAPPPLPSSRLPSSPMPSSPIRPAVAALRLAIDSMVSDRAFANAHWGVLVVDPGRGDTLFSRNTGKLFVPASNQKLLTGSVALARLGAGYRWHTVLGAPADSLKARGIRRIAGRLVEAGDAFPGDGYGVGWAHDDFDEPCSAPVDERFVSDRIARLSFTGGRRVDGGGASDTMPVRPPLDTLVRWESPTLAAVLPHFEKSSQNQVGELLLRTPGRVADTVGTPEAGRRVAVAQLAGWGIDSTMAAVRDGSGLSRHDYVAREAIVRLLDTVRLLPDGGVFRESLPVAGGGGTLARRMRGTPAQGNVRAKTGLVDKARSLSGHVSTADGATLLFSILCNNWTTPVGAAERVPDAIVVQLASPTLAAPDAQRR